MTYLENGNCRGGTLRLKVIRLQNIVPTLSGLFLRKKNSVFSAARCMRNCISQQIYLKFKSPFECTMPWW